jgi:selenocysteine lyase/cysteine desulfurase
MLLSLRDMFDIPPEVTFLDSAAYAPVPHRVRDAGLQGVAQKSQPWRRDPAADTALAERARAAAARLIGGSGPESIAIVGSVSHGIETAARNLGVPAGTRILHVADEFPSLVRPWVRLAAEVGAVVEAVPRPADGHWEAALLQAIERPGALPLSVLAVTPLHWADGSLIPLMRVRKAVARRGAAMVVDATQAVGAMPVDVTQLRPDFLAFPTYKWLLGPYAVAFLYAAPHRRSGRPLEENDFNRPGEEFAAGARRYDRGERADPVALPMAAEAMEFILECGVPNIARRLAYWSGLLAARMAEHGLKLLPPERRAGHILGARLPEGEAERIAAGLRARDVHVSVRHGGLRVSPHLHLTEEDVERFGAALGEAMRS